MSIIYGFFGGSHSPSTTVMVDGKIVCSIEEERITRIKSGDNIDAFPELSSKEVEEYTGIKILDADYKIFVQPTVAKFARELTKNNYESVSHHDAHNYSSYFTSGMDGKVMSISYDGGGDKSVMKVFLCEDGKMNLTYSYDFANSGSLSHLWAFATAQIMGHDENWFNIWKMCKDEGKLMGMAPDGKYDEKIYKMLNNIIDYSNFRFYPHSTGSKAKFLMTVLYEQGYFNTQSKREIFSYNLQKLTEDLFLEFLNDLHLRFPDYKKICFSGGLFANVKLNQKINNLDWVDEIYIVPPMGDEGLSLGACIKKSVELGEIKKPFELQNVFFGKDYTNEYVLNLASKLNFKIVNYEPKKIAEDLHKGSIIGWFQGKFELGPRALGARSILVRPTDVSTHAELNRRLKRYDTMPFAPIVMDEFFDEIFINPKSKYAAQFMTITYDTKEEWIEKIPAVIQKSDKTARPQLVRKTNNPKFWEILNEYRLLSDIPVLLNTSFNSHNQPIIDSPEQALESLQNNIIDKLVINDYVISH